MAAGGSRSGCLRAIRQRMPEHTLDDENMLPSMATRAIGVR